MTLTVFQKLVKISVASMDVICLTWSNKSYNFNVHPYIYSYIETSKDSKHLYESKHILNNICMILFKKKILLWGKILGMNSGDGYTTMWMHLMPQNCILRNDEDGICHVYFSTVQIFLHTWALIFLYFILKHLCHIWKNFRNYFLDVHSNTM